MTEEIKPEATEVVENPVETEARSQGWVSKDEWVAAGKDPEEHRTAKEFKERGELYRSIHTTKRELQQTKAALDSLTKHHQTVYEKAFLEADKKLRAEQRAAIREGNVEVADEIEQERADKKQAHEQQMAQLNKEQAMARSFNNNPPELDAWLARNQWYETDVELREEADTAGRIYLRKGGTREGLLAHVESKIKDRFKERFGEVRKAAPSAVASPARSSKKAAVSEEGLSELETKVMNDLVKSGVMTKEQYIKELRG